MRHLRLKHHENIVLEFVQSISFTHNPPKDITRLANAAALCPGSVMIEIVSEGTISCTEHSRRRGVMSEGA